MSLAPSDTPIMRRFDDICRSLSSRRKGLSPAELRDAHALARELEGRPPNAERIAELRAALDIQDGEA